MQLGRQVLYDANNSDAVIKPVKISPGTGVNEVTIAVSVIQNKLLTFELILTESVTKIKGNHLLHDTWNRVALGVCVALKFVERKFTSFHIFNYLM